VVGPEPRLADRRRRHHDEDGQGQAKGEAGTWTGRWKVGMVEPEGQDRLPHRGTGTAATAAITPPGPPWPPRLRVVPEQGPESRTRGQEVGLPFSGEA
jgi:hypothetical protein